jgi:hypothetical protein
MASKLSTIRDQKDRAEQAYSAALRKEVVALRRQNPMWTLQRIANAMNVSRERIRQLLKSEDMPTAAVSEAPVKGRPRLAQSLLFVTLTCGLCGVTFDRLRRTHRYNQKRGIVGTYCTQNCQRVAFAQWQHIRGEGRTTCSLGHLLTPNNVVSTVTTRASGQTYKGRRCRTCHNAYHRAYYHWKKKQLTEVAVHDNGTE